MNQDPQDSQENQGSQEKVGNQDLEAYLDLWALKVKMDTKVYLVSPGLLASLDQRGKVVYQERKAVKVQLESQD